VAGYPSAAPTAFGGPVPYTAPPAANAAVSPTAIGGNGSYWEAKVPYAAPPAASLAVGTTAIGGTGVGTSGGGIGSYWEAKMARKAARYERKEQRRLARFG
jgi:hypothetical protein